MYCRLSPKEERSIFLLWACGRIILRALSEWWALCISARRVRAPCHPLPIRWAVPAPHLLWVVQKNCKLMLQEQWPAAEGDVTDGVNILLFNTPLEYVIQAQYPDFLCVLHYLTVAKRSRRRREESRLCTKGAEHSPKEQEGRIVETSPKKQQSYCRTEAYNFRGVLVGAEKHVGIQKEEKTK